MRLNQSLFLIILLIFVSYIPLLDLFHPGLPITHDGQDHVARIANFYRNLSEGNIIPRWAANLNWGYGTPILMFLYPLPSYLASIFHFIGFSLLDSTKIVFGITYILSGLSMYLWINEFLGKRAGFVSAILYLFAPYRFVDLYVRGAIGEHVAFIFPPLILYFLLKLSKKYSYWYVVAGSLSLAALILSHNAISLMFIPIIILYAVYLIWQAKTKKLLVMSYGLLAAFGFGLSTFFWVPAFFEGKYTLRDIVTKGGYAFHFVAFRSFFFSQWSYGGSGQFSVQVGIVQWIIVILALPVGIFLRRRKNNLWIMVLGTFVIFWVTLFLMLPESKLVWEKITMLQKFQFPWRFLSVSVFTTAVLGGLLTFVIPKKYQIVVCCLLAFGLLFLSKDYWHAKDYLLEPESFFTGIYKSTTDTGESSPIWSVRFMEKEPKVHIEVISGIAKIKEIRRNSTFHEYRVEAETNARLRENTLYFPGWEVFIDGKKVDIEFQDPANRGLITFYLEEGIHVVQVKFRETRLRIFSDMVSLGSALIVVLGGTLWQKRKVLQKL